MGHPGVFTFPDPVCTRAGRKSETVSQQLIARLFYRL